MLRVRLDDGSLFLLDSDLPAVDGLRLGAVVDQTLRDDLAVADESLRCRKKALELLNRAEQCRHGLNMKLSGRGFGDGPIRLALDRLESAGLLDDGRFSESWVRTRLRSRPEGTAKLLSSLLSKGVRSETARSAIRRVLEQSGDPDGEESLERAWSRISGRPGMTPEKVLRTLAARGFPVGMVRRFLRGKGE